jgi:inosose dehydratase
MTNRLDRRQFSKTLALGLGAAALPLTHAQAKRTIRIGHTGINGANPLAEAPAIEQTMQEIASLGYYGLELFGTNLQAMEAIGALAPAMEKSTIPLISVYCGLNLTEPAERKLTIERAVGWVNLLKKYGGKVAVLGPNRVKRPEYDFKAAKANIVTTLNECAKAMADLGVTPVLHQHTSTCIETRDETVGVMEAADTRYLKFGPDIGQLQKGGADPVEVLKDFLPLVQHCHLKDFSGGEHWLGYCPLGQGKVAIPAILDMLEGRTLSGMVMVELDASPNMPLAPLESSRIAKAYLQKLGCTFRS